MNVPCWFSLSYLRIPVNFVPFLVTVPKNDVSSVPSVARVSVPVEASLFLRPLARVQAVEFTESFKLYRIVVDVSAARMVIPKAYPFLNKISMRWMA